MKIAFFGAGKMAGALIRGFLDAGIVKPGNVCAADPDGGALDALAAECGISTSPTNAGAAGGADVVFLCVKPKDAAHALAGVASEIEGRLMVSIAAGLRVAALREMAPGARVIRVMPNVAALVRRSATAIVIDPPATGEDIQLAERFFGAVGRVVRVAESQMDAVTALSGSGPAFLFLAMEAMADGAVAAGLPRKLAHELAVQTMAGAAEMSDREHPAVLREMVSSPGGTTIAGLLELEKASTRAAFAEAVRAAAARSAELAGS